LLKCVLNNPLCYSHKIVRFFRDHALFSVFPKIERHFIEMVKELPVSSSGLKLTEPADSVITQGNILDWVKVHCSVLGYWHKIGKDQKDFTEYSLEITKLVSEQTSFTKSFSE